MKMSASTRADSASTSLDGSNFAAAYHSVQRGVYSGSGLERSGSFRESLENRILVTGPSTSRNTASSTEILILSQYLSLEPFSMSEQKYSRFGELRRVLGVAVEEHSFGSVQSKALPPITSEDLKRFKASVFESSTRARDRTKSLHESILKLDRYRTLLSRKRQRIDQSNEKSGASNLLKMASQSHQNPVELASPRLEDRTKNGIPNKRIRSSMAEVRSEGRGNGPPRQGALTDKDKTMVRGCNGGPISSEDRMSRLPPGGDGWERKLKRKRSVGLNRITDVDREIKQSIQQRPNSEPRLRSSDGSGFRPGLSNGTIGSNKTDSCSQLSGSNRGTPKNDMDSGSIPNERREHSIGLENEQIVSKGSNKLNIREDAQVGNQSPPVKVKSSRAPRTGSGVAMNASSNFPRSSGSIDGWEQTPGINKVPPLTGLTNRKRSVPTESSSPPVTQWGGQRPHKISRTRRANVVSPVSNLDDAQFLHEEFMTPDVGARMTTVDTTGLLGPRGMPNSTHQPKLKFDNVLSPSVLSESEESAAVENKFEKKGIDNFELEDGVQASLKATTSVFPTKKSKTPPKVEFRDGVRRQGRSGRGSLQSKACLPLPKSKMENGDATKPLKNGKLGSERSESRIGRPPSKKMSDRKACARPHIMSSSSLELTGELDDHEELLAAANSARNASYIACSSTFWKKMEPIFAFVTLEDISYVKHEINFVEELDASLSDRFEAGYDVMGEVLCDASSSPRSSFAREHTNSFEPMHKSVGTLYSSDGAQRAKTSVGRLETKRWYDKIIPLAQRLLSAFVAEDGTEKLDIDTQGESFLQFSSDYVHYSTSNHHEHAKNLMSMKCELEVDNKNRKNSLEDSTHCDGFMASYNHSYSNIQKFMSSDEPLMENSTILSTDNGSFSGYRQSNLNQLQIMDNTSPYECQFEDMSLDDKILMELHSIGIFPDTVPDLAEGEDGEIDKVISELKMRLYQQVMKKKIQLHKLEKAIQDAKEVEQRKLEQLAVNKLVEMAYKRLMGGRGSSSHKSGATKVSRQLALAFAKRIVARCQKFEAGQSCFSEPALRNVMLSAPLHNVDAKHADGSGATNYVESRSGQLGFRASGVTSIMMENHGLGNKIDQGSSDPYQSSPQMGEQSVTKSDRKKKEVLLDDVVTSAASRTISTPTHTLPSNAKWKRTERDTDQNKDALGRSSTAKAGRPSLSGRSERKTKMKPKQKIAQLSTSGNGLGRVTETSNFMSQTLQESYVAVNNPITKIDQEVELQSSCNMGHDLSKEIDDALFTNLPLHGIDSIELDVAEGLDGQGQDIGSWLNVDDDALQDHDLMGLEIPMDDLSELTLNF